MGVWQKDKQGWFMHSEVNGRKKAKAEKSRKAKRAKAKSAKRAAKAKKSGGWL